MIVEILNYNRVISPLKPIQVKTSKSEREFFRLGAESYSSLDAAEKKKEEKYSRPLLDVFTCDKFRVLACNG